MKKTTYKTYEIEREIGKIIKQRREKLKFSQAYVAKLLGITAQQLYKYEKGIDRVSAGRLLAISRILMKPLSYFYKEIDDFYGSENILTVKGITKEGSEIIFNVMDEDSLFADIKIMKKESLPE